MAKNKKKKKKFISIFLTSLLVHVILVVFLIIFAFEKTKTFRVFFEDKNSLSKEKILQDTLKKKLQHQNDIPASLKPRKSVFGATTLFDEIPQFKPAQPTQTQAQARAQTQPEQKQQEIKKQETKKQEPVQKKVQKIDKTKTIPKESKIKELKQTEKEKQDRIKEIEKQQELVAKTHIEKDIANLPETKIEENSGDSQQDKCPIVRGSRKSIVAMTQGFIENLKHKGDDWLERKGDDSKRPSFEELKYISYEQQINWYLQNSWKQNFEHRPWKKIIEGKAVVDFTINQNGNLENLELIESSGSQELDDIVLKSVKFASPFPPLPKHFEKNFYRTGRIIYVNAHRIGF